MSIKIVVMGALGRMGSTIIRFAGADPELEVVGVVERATCREGLRGFECTAGVDIEDVLPQTPGAVVVDFTAPEATVATARACARHGNPLVAGTTGLSPEQRADLAESAKSAPMLWSPNMSLGVNVLIEVLPRLVKLLGPGYDLELVELHHNQKKDSPSGTALKLAECLAEARGWDLEQVANFGRHGIVGARPKEELGIQAVRGGDVVGVHTVYLMGTGERLELTHQAHSREMFAGGALRAVKWITGKTAGRLYTFRDMLVDE